MCAKQAAEAECLFGALSHTLVNRAATTGSTDRRCMLQVIVTEGDLKNMVGTITVVRDGGKNVDVLPEMEGLEAVPMSASAVEKWFAVRPILHAVALPDIFTHDFMHNAAICPGSAAGRTKEGCDPSQRGGGALNLVLQDVAGKMQNRFAARLLARMAANKQ